MLDYLSFKFFKIKFSELSSISDDKVDVIIFDLGLSSIQLDDLERGFSFKSNKKLDMTMGLNEVTALDVVNNLSEINLRLIIKIFGDEKKLPLDLRKILKKIIKLTKKNKKITVNLAINYGSKQEILSAAKKTKNLNFKNFKKNHVFIGTELAFDLNLVVGDTISLMSSAFVATPFGTLPKQESFKVAGIFSTGFIEFDQNVVFINISDALSIFEKKEKDQNIEVYLKDPLRR